jgi:hypothetical protein
MDELFRSRGLDVDVHGIDEVDLAGVSVDRSPFCSGNRARIAAFAKLMQAESTTIRNAICFVDCDCERISPVLSPSPNLVLSDYASLYASYADPAFVNAMAVRAFKSGIDDSSWSLLVDACRFLFAFRIFRYREFPAAEALSADNALKRDRGLLIVDRAGYSEKFISKNGIKTEIEVVLDAVQQISNDLVGDSRCFTHFHDFLELLTALLRHLRILNASFRQEHLRAILYAAAHPDILVSQPAIEELLRWAGR